MSDDTTNTPVQPIIPWTLKGIAQEDREQIAAAAKRADQTIGEWVKGAARLAISIERNGTPPPHQHIEEGPTRADCGEYLPPLLVAVEAVSRLAAVLPRLTTQARGGGRLASLARRAIAVQLASIGSNPIGQTGEDAPRQVTSEVTPP